MNRYSKLSRPRARTSKTFDEKASAALRLIRKTGGRALVLFPDRSELKRFKAAAAREAAEAGSVRFLFEGDGEISRLIADFQRDETSVLCASSLWEGLDIPGPSLSNVIVWSLPFPPNDPVFDAKRETSAAPFEEVDMPYMLLRLKQGMGRLIRSREDSGVVAILSDRIHQEAGLRAKIEKLLPEGVSLGKL